MQFRTPTDTPGGLPPITHRSRIFMLGSCFTDEIGNRLRNDLFAVMANPFGAIFNPVSMADTLRLIKDADRPPLTAADFFESEGRWVSCRFHSSVSGLSQESALTVATGRLQSALRWLCGCDTAILTFGSSVIFHDTVTGRTVANCHKLPATRFERIILDNSSTAAAVDDCIAIVKEINPAINILLTVSPVRHKGYGLTIDRLSKSRLICACHDISLPTPQVNYFPSYEALVDDLRDYRFYADDLVHPSAMGVDYVYSLFCDATMDKATQADAAACRKLTRRLAHRHSPGDPNRLKFEQETRAIATTLARRLGIPNLSDRYDLPY